MKEIRALTSIRGLAALWVLLFHLDTGRALFPQGLRHWLAIGRGYIAVDLFFVLSGFVMALTYRQSFLARSFRAAYPDFLLRRVARVMPLNMAIVLAIALIVWLAPERAGDGFAAAKDPRTVIANLLLVQDWGLAPSIDKPSWSVSIEMGVYLIYPMLLWLAWSRAWILPALAGAAALGWLAEAGQGIVSQGLLVGDIIRGLAGFYFGLLCFRIFGNAPALSRSGRLELWVVALFWAALVWSPTDLIPILLCPALVLCLAAERGPAARVLAARPLHYLGQISYSVYLVHFPVLGSLDLLPIGSAAIYGLLAVALTLAVSAVTYHAIELPARRWIGRMARCTAPVRRAIDPAIVGRP